MTGFLVLSDSPFMGLIPANPVYNRHFYNTVSVKHFVFVSSSIQFLVQQQNLNSPVICYQVLYKPKQVTTALSELFKNNSCVLQPGLLAVFDSRGHLSYHILNEQGALGSHDAPDPGYNTYSLMYIACMSGQRQK